MIRPVLDVAFAWRMRTARASFMCPLCFASGSAPNHVLDAPIRRGKTITEVCIACIRQCDKCNARFAADKPKRTDAVLFETCRDCVADIVPCADCHKDLYAKHEAECKCDSDICRTFRRENVITPPTEAQYMITSDHVRHVCLQCYTSKYKCATAACFMGRCVHGSVSVFCCACRGARFGCCPECYTRISPLSSITRFVPADPAAAAPKAAEPAKRARPAAKRTGASKLTPAKRTRTGKPIRTKRTKTDKPKADKPEAVTSKSPGKIKLYNPSILNADPSIGDRTQPLATQAVQGPSGVYWCARCTIICRVCHAYEPVSTSGRCETCDTAMCNVCRRYIMRSVTDPETRRKTIECLFCTDDIWWFDKCAFERVFQSFGFRSHIPDTMLFDVLSMAGMRCRGAACGVPSRNRVRISPIHASPVEWNPSGEEAARLQQVERKRILCDPMQSDDDEYTDTLSVDAQK